MDFAEEKAKVLIEIQELTMKMQQLKETEQQLLQELLKKQGQIEFIDKLALEQDINNDTSTEDEENE